MEKWQHRIIHMMTRMQWQQHIEIIKFGRVHEYKYTDLNTLIQHFTVRVH